MEPKEILTDDRLKTPRPAAVAGIVFSVLFIISLALLRATVPADPQDAGSWLARDLKTVAFAIYLLPFAGIAFLWFIGVRRDRMGTREDRFFATIFMGSGLLFLPCSSSPGRSRRASSWDLTPCRTSWLNPVSTRLVVPLCTTSSMSTGILHV